MRHSRLAFIVPFAMLSLVGLYLVFAFVMVYAATQPQARKPFEQRPEDFGLVYEDVMFKPRGSDLTLRGWFLPGQPEAPFLIFVHGINSQRTNAKALELASRLVIEQGYNVLMFDLRAHGESDGTRVTAGEKERYDVLGAYDYALTRGAQPGRIGLVGQSYGGGIAIMAAAKEPGIVAVVADSAFANVQDKASREIAIRTPIPEWAVSVFMPAANVFGNIVYGINIDDLSPEKDVARLKYPVLLIHGTADTRTPVSHSQRIFAKAPQGSDLWTPEGVEHTKAFEVHPDEYIQRVGDYLSPRFAAPGY
jgi:pimeloyl-ACP methyl ester carboxylesterase